jgi:hypothetical protein
LAEVGERYKSCDILAISSTGFVLNVKVERLNAKVAKDGVVIVI